MEAARARREIWGPLGGACLQDLADLPVGALAHLTRFVGDPLYRLSRDMPNVAEQVRDMIEDEAEDDIGEFDIDDPTFELKEIDPESVTIMADGDDTPPSVEITRVIRTVSTEALTTILAKKTGTTPLKGVLKDLCLQFHPLLGTMS